MGCQCQKVKGQGQKVTHPISSKNATDGRINFKVDGNYHYIG